MKQQLSRERKKKKKRQSLFLSRSARDVRLLLSSSSSSFFVRAHNENSEEKPTTELCLYNGAVLIQRQKTHTTHTRHTHTRAKNFTRHCQKSLPKIGAKSQKCTRKLLCAFANSNARQMKNKKEL